MASSPRERLDQWASWLGGRDKWVGSSCASFCVVREGVCHQFSDILHPHALLDSLRLDTIFKHLHTERAAGRHHGRTSLDSLLRADMVDAPPDIHFHERMPSPGAAAQALPLIPAHLLGLEPRDRLQGLTWFGKDVVVAPEIAGIVVGHLVAQRLCRSNAAVLQQSGNELAVVHDLKMSPKLRILILQGIKTVRAMRHNLFDSVVLKRLNVLLGQHLKEIFVTQTPGRITSTGLLLPQNGKTHPGGLQNFHEGFCDLDIAVYQGARAPDPEEILSVRVLSQQWHRQALGPSRTCGLCATPGVPALLHTAQSRFGSF